MKLIGRFRGKSAAQILSGATIQTMKAGNTEIVVLDHAHGQPRTLICNRGERHDDWGTWNDVLVLSSMYDGCVARVLMSDKAHAMYSKLLTDAVAYANKRAAAARGER